MTTFLFCSKSLLSSCLVSIYFKVDPYMQLSIFCLHRLKHMMMKNESLCINISPRLIFKVVFQDILHCLQLHVVLY